MAEEKNTLLEAIGILFQGPNQGKGKNRQKYTPQYPSVVPKKNVDDGAIELSSTGVFGQYIDLEGKVSNDFDLVSKYRDVALQPEIDFALGDIVNEAIVIDEDDPPVVLNLDDLDKFSKKVKDKILEEFENIIELLDFNNRGHDVFRQWYVDGRLYYHVIIDDKAPKEGIKELRNIDPRKIKKIREVIKEKRPDGIEYVKGTDEYYIYNAQGFTSGDYKKITAFTPGTTALIRLDPSIISYVTSGILDTTNQIVFSPLHKAIKPLNQLRMLEDSVVIYRLARAPERRIFYIDVGNLPKVKAEEYLNNVMNRYKNKMVYDITTGEIRDDKRHLSMLEDFWIPRREGGKGTEIQTLNSGQNLGEMEDVDYFKKKLFRALNVPYSRLDTESQWTLGKATEITRDEVRFNRYIGKIRNKFNDLFDDLLGKQLLLKGIVTEEDWKEIKSKLNYFYARDSYFSEMKEIEVMKERFGLLQQVDQFTTNSLFQVAKKPYVSIEWARRYILQQAEEEIKQLDKEIEKEQTEVPDVIDQGQYDDQMNDQSYNQEDQEAEEIRAAGNKGTETGGSENTMNKVALNQIKK